MELPRHFRLVAPHFGARATPGNDSPLKPLKIAGLYADQPSHMLAMSVLRNVARRCSAVSKLHSDWWSFDMLKTATERDTAARAAAKADMVWCATNACEGLPEVVTMWTDLWLTCRRESQNASLSRCCAVRPVTQWSSRLRGLTCAVWHRRPGWSSLPSGSNGIVALWQRPRRSSRS